MKTHRPRSLLAHIFLLSILLVGITNASWWLAIHLDSSRSRDFAQFLASAVNLVRVALLTSDPELRPQLLQDLSVQEGIRILPRDPEDQVAPQPLDKFYPEVQAELRRLLGPKTQFSRSVNQEPGLWVSFSLTPEEDAEDAFWLILTRNRTESQIPWRWFGWGALSACFSLAAAWVLASRINRRLRRMMLAAQQVGRGDTPLPLPEEGPDELLQLARAFNRMSSDLEYSEKERVEILAGISHDLRTPLARMRLEVEMSLPEGQSRVGMVADIAQMDAIIAQFLDYARGAGDEALTECDPGTLLDARARHEAAIQRPLTLDMGALPRVALKPRAIQRALANLIDNAWKYGAPPVVLSGRVEAGFLRLSVADDGEGVPEAEMERLKQPFTRRETARSGASGTGLGLAIAERVARDHGGSLELARGPAGHGLLATLKLPLVR
ncbi:MAG: HAMP domain-containing protein [Zoogloeaceae bacterium]|jgi:two-component system osmolarity sensor histidine kinase EnvZ|nr:HAMP domain-containing protein [Zoogloeaceae bacterium]